MAATLTLDRIDGASLDIDGSVKRVTRGGYAKGLDTSDPQETLWQIFAIANCPQLGDVYSGKRQDMKLQRVVAVPVPPDQARIRFFYETPVFGGTPAAYVITEDTTAVDVETDMVSRTRQQLRFTYDVKVGGTVVRTIEDNARGKITRNYKALSISALMSGSPLTNNSDYVDYCNADFWKGKKAGFWKLTHYRTSVSKYSGYFSLDAMAESRNYQDWSEWETMYDPLMKRNVEVDGAAVTAALALNYSEGIIYGAKGGTGSGKGVIRWGPYPTVSFALIFGFS